MEPNAISPTAQDTQGSNLTPLAEHHRSQQADSIRTDPLLQMRKATAARAVLSAVEMIETQQTEGGD